MADLTTDELVQKISALAKPLVDSTGIELVEVKVKRHQKDVSVEIMADKTLGGITIEECSTLNHSLGEAIDQAGFIPVDCYTLEVSSPGLDRPLTTHKDFLRNLNYDVHFYLNEPINGKKEIIGLLMAATQEKVTIFTKKKIEVVIPMANIVRGMLVI